MSATRYLDLLRRRAWFFFGVRALALGLGGGALAFALVAVLVGPTVSLFGALAAWLAVLAGAGTGMAWALHPTRELRGTAIAKLLDPVDPMLVSLARSAAELSLAPSGSAALVAAHAEQVGLTLSAVPLGRVVDLGWLRHRTIALAALGGVLSLATLTAFDRGRSGAFALLHPGARDSHGKALADLVTTARWTLTFPAYMHRAPESLGDVASLQVPIGTNATIRVETRIGVDEAQLLVGDEPLRLIATSPTTLEGQLVVRKSGELLLRFLRSGEWLSDRKSRSLVALEDQAPQVTIVEPSADEVVELDETVTIAYEARDDVGLERLELVIRTPDAREERKMLPIEDAHSSAEDRDGSGAPSAPEQASAHERAQTSPVPAGEQPTNPGQATPPQATPPQATPPQATPPQATPPQATPPQATPPQGTSPQAIPPQAKRPQVGRGIVPKPAATPQGRAKQAASTDADPNASTSSALGGSLIASAKGETAIAIAKLALRPGDRIQVWIEATDGDVLRGPHLGRSGERTFTVASEATRRAQTLGNLEALRDQSLKALADRLETPIGNTVDEARKRHGQMGASTRAFLDAADEGLSSFDADDRETLRALSKSLRASADRESSLYDAKSPAIASLKRADQTLVEQLEDATLELSDRLGQARLQDAAAIAQELELLRREMASLLAELKRTDSPEARQKLLGALARARQRLTDLRSRLAALSQDAPGEFMNMEALDVPQKEAALDALSKALDANDLDGASQSLHELEREIDSLAEALGTAQDSYDETRFGEANRALAEALDTLVGLEHEQRRLAGRSDSVRQRAARRAVQASHGHGVDVAGLTQTAKRALKAVGAVSGRSLGPVEREAIERASQRVADTRDALGAGDLGEARRMAEEAGVALQNVTRDLDLAALMFPGAHGETADAAAQARRAEEVVAQLQADLDRSIPRLKDHLTDEDRSRFSEDTSRQQRVRDLSGQLREKLSQTPRGARRAAAAAEAIHDATRSMSVAEEGLKHYDPVQAASYQEESARRLTQAREALEKGMRPPPSGGGQGQGQGREASGMRDRRRVEIPTKPADVTPPQLRRRLLDAMQQKAPGGYEQAVQRYYEELLR